MIEGVDIKCEVYKTDTPSHKWIITEKQKFSCDAEPLQDPSSQVVPLPMHPLLLPKFPLQGNSGTSCHIIVTDCKPIGFIPAAHGTNASSFSHHSPILSRSCHFDSAVQSYQIGMFLPIGLQRFEHPAWPCPFAAGVTRGFTPVPRLRPSESARTLVSGSD